MKENDAFLGRFGSDLFDEQTASVGQLDKARPLAATLAELLGCFGVVATPAVDGRSLRDQTGADTRRSSRQSQQAALFLGTHARSSST
jgi:hypothetical protein